MLMKMCSQNWWRHCKIILFAWTPWICDTHKLCSDTRVTSLGRVIVLTNKYGQPFNWKSIFLSLLTKAFFTVGLFCTPCLHAPLKQDWSHLTTLHFNVYAHQSTAVGLSRHFQYIISAYFHGFNVINTCCQW